MSPIDIDTFYNLMTEVCEELPDEFFDDLHYGVVCSEELKFSENARHNDLVTMGQYQTSKYGNKIVIYYGSFMYSYPNATEDELKDLIRKTVRHEFRHHMENRAGMLQAKGSLHEEDVRKLNEYISSERK